MMNIPINLVFEDAVSEYVMTKLLSCFGSKYLISSTYQGYGFGYIKTNINGFNQAAMGVPFFILTDLDNSICPISLINEWLPKPKATNLIFRVAIREVEAWLLADREGFSEYTGISLKLLPREPEKEQDPKRTLINLVRSKCRKRAIREDIVPINANAQIGPNYNERLMQFIYQHWDLDRAKETSESLMRAYNHLDRFQFNSF